MLFIKVWGIRETPIGVDEYLLKCPSCESHSWADVMVLSRYQHCYFVPMWPIAKEANVICRKCGLKRIGIAFDGRLMDNFEEVKSRYRHPWFCYIGITLFSLFTFAVLLTQYIPGLKSI
jgi:hypothetical protein